MIDGVFEYEQGEDPYDIGSLTVEVKETEKALRLKIIKSDMRYSTYVDVLFQGKKQVTIKKEKSPHKVDIGKGWFVVYPQRRGVPLMFQERPDRMSFYF